MILRDWNFILLFLAFSFSTGVSWVFLAVVGQLIGPCGYDFTVVTGALSSLYTTSIQLTYLINTPYQHNLSLLLINPSSQPTLSTHPLNPSQPIHSTHPFNPPTHSIHLPTQLRCTFWLRFCRCVWFVARR